MSLNFIGVDFVFVCVIVIKNVIVDVFYKSGFVIVVEDVFIDGLVLSSKVELFIVGRI